MAASGEKLTPSSSGTRSWNPFGWYSSLSAYRKQLSLPSPGTFEGLHREAKNAFTTNYGFDGAQANIIKELSQNFHVQHQFTLGSSVAPQQYNFSTGYVTDRTQLQGSMDSDWNVNATVKHMWSQRDSTKFQASLSSAPGHSMLQIEQDRFGTDYSLNAKIINPNPLDNTGIFLASYMQSVTRGLSLGTEVLVQRPTPDMEETATSFVAKYAKSDYITTIQSQGSGVIQATYFQRINEKVEFGVELNLLIAGGRREAVCTVGGKFDFRQATFRGQIDTAGRLSAVLEEKIAPGFSFLISGDLDHVKGQSKFGVGIMLST